MTETAFNMANTIDAVDPMVLALKVAVEDVLDKSKLFAFQICMSEALTNVVEHASSIEGATIEIALIKRDDTVAVEIFDLDGAVPFDLREHATNLSSVDVMSEGGRGLGLITECADRVEYGAIDGRNRLSLGFDNVA